MALTSRLAAAEDGLLSAIQTQAAVPGSALAGVALRLGDPGSGIRPEHVWIREEATAERLTDVTPQAVATGGDEERFELMVRIMTTRSGDDYDTLRDRATALAAEIETAVLNARTLGGAVEDAFVTRIERETGATEAGRAIVTTVVVEAVAWLA